MKIQYRILDKEDLNQYQKLKLFSFKESPYAFSESYEDELRRDAKKLLQELNVVGEPPESFVLGAFDQESKLVGIVRFVRDQRSKARHKSMIKTMYILPEYRGKKIGRNMILNLFDRIDKIEGLEQIHLWVLHAKTNVSEFYKNCGFESQGTLVKRDLKIGDDYVDAEYLVKYL